MERSRINRLIDDALAFMHELRFELPPFATWTPDQWQNQGLDAQAVVDEQLGWDVTDFGTGGFDRCGLLLFTLRNGNAALSGPSFKPYAEKVMVVGEAQWTPCHFHSRKMEDIINRGGGELVVQLWPSDDGDKPATGQVRVAVNSIVLSLPAGEKVSLKPGDSICFPPRLYHAFWAAPGGGPVLAGEVSSFNDDRTDNHFYQPVGRFPEIREDELPRYLLIPDYPAYCRFAENEKQS